MGSYDADEDGRRIYLVSSALSPEEYRYYPHWFAQLVPPGHLTLTLDDMLVFCDRFGIAEQDKWKIFDIFESPLSTLEKGEFYAFLRLVGHVMNGKAPSRSLAFQQAPVPRVVQDAEVAVALQSDITNSPTASQRPSLTLPASSGPSPVHTSSDPPVSPVVDGSRVNPFRRYHEQSRRSQESPRSTDSSTPIASSEISLPNARKSKETVLQDVQAVDAFTQMLLGEVGDAAPRKSSDFAVTNLSNQAGSSEIKQEDPVVDMSDIEEPSSSLSSEADDDDAIYEESTSTAKIITPDDSISLVAPDKLDLQHPAVPSLQSQPVVPKETDLHPPPRKSLETDYSKRPAPPPPRPRKSGYGVNVSHPIVATTMTQSSEPSTVHLSSVGSSRSSSSSSLPTSISKPVPLIPQTENNRKSPASVRSLSLSSALNSPGHHSSSSHDVSTPATSVVTDVDFDAAFDGQQLFPAVGSPPNTRFNVPPTVVSSQKSHAPPPPPPSRRRVSQAKDQSIGPSSTTTTRGHRPPPHPNPPVPPASSSSLGTSTTATPTTSSSKAVAVDDSAVPDLLADLTALQRELDELREHHLQDM
ncbi:hypothetical protein V1509DRAFT_664183 [Lipomyces kononenkoae]